MRKPWGWGKRIVRNMSSNSQFVPVQSMLPDCIYAKAGVK